MFFYNHMEGCFRMFFCISGSERYEFSWKIHIQNIPSAMSNTQRARNNSWKTRRYSPVIAQTTTTSVKYLAFPKCQPFMSFKQGNYTNTKDCGKWKLWKNFTCRITKNFHISILIWRKAFFQGWISDTIRCR